MQNALESKNLSTSDEGIIHDILPHEMRVRLIELGFQTGKKVTILKRSYWSQTVLVLLSGQVYALRKDEAQLILLSA